ncbi:jg13489, partial [Pararge aegeria aegeria]
LSVYAAHHEARADTGTRAAAPLPRAGPAAHAQCVPRSPAIQSILTATRLPCGTAPATPGGSADESIPHASTQALAALSF